MSINIGNSKLYNVWAGVSVTFMTFYHFVERTNELYRFDWDNKISEETKGMFDAGVKVDDTELMAHGLRKMKNDRLLRDEVTMVMLNSAFVSANSIFEVFLNDICETIVDKSKIMPHEIASESYNEKNYLFLTKVFGVTLSDLSTEWNLLLDYAKIRNKIVHSLSRVKWQKGQPDGKQPELYRLVKQFKEIEITEISSSSVQFKIQDTAFVHNYCNTAQNFLTRVLERVDGRLAELRT